jgi:hypothetical protein
MPKIYRGMKQDQGKPAIGTTGVTLGIRVPVDIEADANGLVHAGTGGMSVSPTLLDLPKHRVPTRLQTIYPAASGNDNLCVWSLGSGEFFSGAIAEHLRLRLDPVKAKHGFVEPSASMSLEQYQHALQSTQDGWIIDEK